MAFDSEAFRQKYRSEISPGYNGWLHMLVVFSTGLLVISIAAAQVEEASIWEWLVVPVTLVMVNFAEYAAHRWLGHRKTNIGRMFYSRHTGDHHSFFIQSNMPFQSVRDWRVVLFPAYLIYAFLIGLILPGGAALYFLVSPNAAFLYAATGIFAYLFYEVMHFSYHLPQGSFVEKTPGWKQLRRLHLLHHRREKMTQVNFNITLPIFDVLLGTLFWDTEKD